jgi:hypothetical protein
LGGTEAIEILVLYTSKLLDLMSGAKAARSTSELHPERAEKLRESTPPPRPTPTPTAPPPVAPAPVEEVEDSGTVMLSATDLNMQSSPSVAAPSGPPPAAVEAEEPADKQHDDAKRFARLLVSEIKLYNESKVEEGRRNKDVYNQLREDIERSRKLYSERYPDAPPGYFNGELVRVLAGGDEGALGHPL